MDGAAIHQYLSQFRKCPGCGQVFPEEDGMKYVMVSVPAPCCGAPGPRGIWPEPAVALFIEAARRLDPKEEATPRIQVLMLAAAAEAMMQAVVWAALDQRISNAAVARVVMDRADSAHRLKEVFKGLVGEAVDDVLRREKFADFAKDWLDVARARNSVAHGQWDHSVDDARLKRFADSLIPAGAAMWNAAVRTPTTPVGR